MSVTGAEWPDFVAQQKGFYATQGLDVHSSLMGAPATATALVSGSVDIAFTSPTALITADAGGANLVAVGSGISRAPYHLMTPPQIKTFADLKGKIISAASPTEAYTVVLHQILQKNGLDPTKDVQWVYSGSSNDRFAAIQTGQIQATLVLPPQDQVLTDKGYNTLAFVPDYAPDLQLSVTAVKRDWANKNPDTVRRYIRAYADASKWLNDPSHRQEAITILANATKVSQAAAAHAYDEFVTRAKAFPDNGCIQRTGMEQLVQLLKSVNALKDPSATADAYVDTEWCPAQ